MDLGSEAMASGQATIQGFLDGATGMLPMVQSAYNQIGQAALRALYGNRRIGHRGASVYPGMVEQAYADGTTSAEAGLALVGEEGPELVMMQGGETVLNASRTKATVDAMTSGYTGAIITVEFNIEGNVDETQMNRLEAYGDEFAARVMAVVRDADDDSRRGRYA